MRARYRFLEAANNGFELVGGQWPLASRTSLWVDCPDKHKAQLPWLDNDPRDKHKHRNRYT